MPRHASECEIRALMAETDTYWAGPHDRRCRECDCVQPRHLPSCSLMGYAPPPPCPPCDSWPDEALAEYVHRRRSSIFAFRRREAYRLLCELLIPRREVACGYREPDAVVRRHL